MGCKGTTISLNYQTFSQLCCLNLRKNFRVNSDAIHLQLKEGASGMNFMK